MPFPGTKVIPTGWSRHHAPVADGGHNATVKITRSSAAAAWNPDTEQNEPAAATVLYDGTARVQQLSGAPEVDQADQDVTAHTYLIQLTFDAGPVEQGDTVTVTSAVNDGHLVDWTKTRPMRVTDVQHGSERFTRDLVAELNLD